MQIHVLRENVYYKRCVEARINLSSHTRVIMNAMTARGFLPFIVLWMGFTKIHASKWRLKLFLIHVYIYEKY